jgi:L-ascorbate metabolism protein UlaG (beta-lactamase superfamily)
MTTGKALIEEISREQVAPGVAAFWWLGQMSFVIKAGGQTLYFDPYLAPRPTRQVAPLFAAEAVTNADLVFGTHDHSDHIDPVAIKGIAAASPQARFVCSRVARKKVLSLDVPSERIIGLDEGIVHEQPGLRISAIAAEHEFFDRDAELGYPYLCYIVEVGGVTILHMGDTLRYDGMVAKLNRWQFDVMFVPINGRDAERYARRCLGNMTFQEAVDLAGVLKPRLTVPGHYDMFANNSQDPAAFADYMRLKFPAQEFWIGEHGAKVRFGATT